MSRRTTVLATALVAIIGFGLAGYLYKQSAPEQMEATSKQPANESELVRFHSPIMGPSKARVTIVEFFDPACESCRAFYPVVKQIMSEHGNNVRVVLRYAPLHDGSEEAVRILETARRQGKFQPVLEALLDAQPVWASHHSPNMVRAWEAARDAGLDETRARSEMNLPEIDAIIKQDVADMKALRVRGTPTFYVNGNPLLSFGRKQLEDQVRREVVASN
jgi:protein-disulfide isomerase